MGPTSPFPCPALGWEPQGSSGVCCPPKKPTAHCMSHCHPCPLAASLLSRMETLPWDVSSRGQCGDTSPRSGRRCTHCAWLLPQSQKTHLTEGKVMRDDVPSAVRCFGGAQRQIPTPLAQGSLTCHSLSSSRYFSTVLSTPSTELPPPSLSSVGSRGSEGGLYAIPHSARHQIYKIRTSGAQRPP